jgi:hypothetical protein
MAAYDKMPNLYLAAFKEQYNLIALFGIAGVALVTGSWLPILAGAVGEAAYVLFFSESGFYKRLTNLRQGKAKAKQRRQQLDRTVTNLPQAYRSRCEGLSAGREIILQLSRRPDIAIEMFSEEISKLNYLYETFVGFADLVVHYRRYLHDISLESINQDLQRIEEQLKNVKETRTSNILKKNLDILNKRKKRRDTLINTVKNLEAQMEVIENTFSLVNEQMMTIKEPSEISGDLDDLINGVELTADLVKESSSYLDDLRKLQMIAR